MDMSNGKSVLLQRNPAVSVRKMDDDRAVLFNSDNRREKVLNATGLFIWQTWDGLRSTADAARLLGRKCGVADDCGVAADVESFSEVLLSEGYVLPLEKPVRNPGPPQEVSSDRDSPKQFDLSLTGKCNLHCPYCFYANEMEGRRDVPAEQWFRFFEEIKALGVRSLTLSGGEVFVRPDLWELIDAIVDARMRFCFLSNGTLIDAETLERLQEPSRRRRLDDIQISIDGSCAEVHDGIRGAGSFDRSIRALRLLREARIPVAVRTTINRHNVDDIENIAAFLLDDIGLSSFGTNDAMPMGAGCDNQRSITLTARQQLHAMRTCEMLEKRYNGRITATAGPLSKIKSYREMERARLTGEKTGRWRMGYLTACGGVFNKLSVNHDGIITPCNILPGTELGRINRDPIPRVWKEHPALESLRNRRKISMRDVPGCEDCEWAEFCNGSCPGLACEMTGDFNRGNPHDCYRRFLTQISEGDRKEVFIDPSMANDQ